MKRRLGKPLLSNLSISRPAPPLLEPHEESRLIRDGDYGHLIEHHLPYIRAECRKRWQRLAPWIRAERSITFDDFVAAAIERCLKAAQSFGAGANNGFNALARHYIAGAISDTATGYRDAFAFTGLDGDLQRRVRSRLDWSPEWIQEKYPEYSLAQIEEAQEIAAALMKRRWARFPILTRNDLLGSHTFVGSPAISPDDWPAIRREVALQRFLGPRAYATWLLAHAARRRAALAPLGWSPEIIAPFESEIAEYYRSRGWTVDFIATTLIQPGRRRQARVGPGQDELASLWWNRRAFDPVDGLVYRKRSEADRWRQRKDDELRTALLANGGVRHSNLVLVDEWLRRHAVLWFFKYEPTQLITRPAIGPHMIALPFKLDPVEIFDLDYVNAAPYTPKDAQTIYTPSRKELMRYAA